MACSNLSILAVLALAFASTPVAWGAEDKKKKADPMDSFKVKIDRSDSDDVENRYQLEIGEKKIGSMESIGGAPLLRKLEAKRENKYPHIFALHYDAGISGTRSLYQMDRIMILLKDKSGQWSQGPDFLFRIFVLNKDKVIHKEIRKLNWSKDSSQLSLGSIEDQDEGIFREVSGKFLRVK